MNPKNLGSRDFRASIKACSVAKPCSGSGTFISMIKRVIAMANTASLNKISRSNWKSFLLWWWRFLDVATAPFIWNQWPAEPAKPCISDMLNFISSIICALCLKKGGTICSASSLLLKSLINHDLWTPDLQPQNAFANKWEPDSTKSFTTCLHSNVFSEWGISIKKVAIW